MGNHKFRLSDMMPKTLFYKLKHMTNNASSGSHHSNHHKHKHNNVNQKHKQPVEHFVTRNHMMSPTRKSYYFTRTNSNSSIDTLFTDHPLSSMNDRSNLAPPPTPIRVDIRSDRALPTESSINENVSLSCSSNYEPRNIVIDIDGANQLAAKIKNSEDFVTIFDLELRPILTKPKSGDSKKQSMSKGLKMRKINSPRIINNRTTMRNSVSSTSNTTTTTTPTPTTSSSCSKKSGIAESLAIVKRSKNPKKDFKKSMVEMIVENEIRSSKELKELLACYLSLNSDEYHDMIISVFKQIWFQISNNDEEEKKQSINDRDDGGS